MVVGALTRYTLKNKKEKQIIGVVKDGELLPTNTPLLPCLTDSKLTRGNNKFIFTNPSAQAGYDTRCWNV